MTDAARLPVYRAFLDGKLLYEGRPVQIVVPTKDGNRVGFRHDIPWRGAVEAFEDARR